MSNKKQYPVIVTPAFTVSFPALIEPDELSGKYKIEAIFNQGEGIEKIKAAVKQAAIDFFGPQLPKNFRAPWAHDKREDGTEKYDGETWVKMSSKRRPIVCDRANQTAEASTIYGGAVCRAVVTVWPYKHASGKCGVTLFLSAVQFLRDGDPRGGATVDALSMLESAPLDGMADDTEF